MSLFQSSMFGSAEATDMQEEPLVETFETDEEAQAQLGELVEEDDVPVSRLSKTPFDVERSCTDWWCLIIALVATIGAVFLCHHLHTGSNLDVLAHGYSYQQLVCPSEAKDPLHLGQKSKPKYAFWCLNATRTGLVLDEPICVEKCPISDYTYHLCQHGQVQRQDYASVQSGFYCSPLDAQLRSEVQRAFSSRRGRLLRLFGVVIREWFLFAMGAVIACIIGYLYMIALFFDAETVIHRTLTLITFLPLGSGLYLLLTALEPFEGTSVDVYAYVDLSPQEAEHQKIIVGSSLTLVGVLLWCLTSSQDHRNTVHRAAACMEAAGDCMTEEWSILLAPLFAIMFEVIIMVFGFYFTCTVAAKVQARELERERFDYTYGTTFAKEDTIQFGPKEWAELAFVFLFAYWLNEVVVAASQCVVAFVTEVWYFARDDERQGILCQAYLLVLAYHLGTTCLGAAFKAFGRLPAYVIGLLRNRGMITPGSLLDQFYFVVLGDGVTFAYVDLGFRSEGYIDGAFSADKILKDELENVHKIRGALWMFNVAGVGLTAAGAAYLMDLIIQLVPSFRDPSSNLFIVEKRGVFLINGVVGAILGRNIMVGFDIVFDTIIYCYAIELKRRKEESDREETSFRENNRMLLWLMPAEDKEEDSDPEANHFLPQRMKDAYSSMTSDSFKKPVDG